MTDTTVIYHRDGYGPARPAICVKLHTSHQVLLPSGFQTAFANGTTRLDDRADRYIAAAYNIVQSDFWQAASEIAVQRGLGEIAQEDRSGGWLVFTDGLSFTDGYTEAEDFARWPGRAEWLAAYAAMTEWVNAELAAIPARVARIAQGMAMDDAGADAARRMFGKGMVPA